MASKTKAQLLAEARKAGIKGLSAKSTVKQIRSALGAAKDTKPATQPAKTKAKRLTPDEEQAQMVAEREERRTARRAEQAQAAAARIENEAAAKALIRSAVQQAADRAKAGS